MEMWLTIGTPGGVHCWPLADPDDPTPEVLAARAAVGFPAHDAWPEMSGWDLQLAPGRPHDLTLAGATVHEPGSLVPADGAAYGVQLAQARQSVKRADARARWDELPADVRAELLAERPPLAPSKNPRT